MGIHVEYTTTSQLLLGRLIRPGLTNLLNHSAPRLGENHRLHLLPATHGVIRVGVFTVRGGIDPGDHRCRSWSVGIVYVLKYMWSGHATISYPGAVEPRCCPHSQSAISHFCWGFHTVRGGDHRRFCPSLVTVVDVWQDFWSGNGKLSSPGTVKLHEPQAIGRQLEGLGFPRRAERYRPGVFVSGLSWILRYGSAYDPRMGPYSSKLNLYVAQVNAR